LVLNSDQTKKRLRVLIERQKSDCAVSKRDLRAVLTKEEFEAYEDNWQSHKEFEEGMRKAPDGLLDYLALLKSADALTGRAEKMYAKGNSARSVVLYREVQAKYERAYENLREALSTDSSLAMWLDRNFNFTSNEMPDLTAEDAPRLRYGRSLNKQGGNSKKMKIKDLKLTTLEDKLADLMKTKHQGKEEQASIGTKNIFEILSRSRDD